jgi:hypothetical protein
MNNKYILETKGRVYDFKDSCSNGRFEGSEKIC